uniref:Uncharacterized protein n=1 Tax=Cucumis melo TaxID=3656 RepID=A0A9I9E5I1_CUCME
MPIDFKIKSVNRYEASHCRQISKSRPFSQPFGLPSRFRHSFIFHFQNPKYRLKKNFSIRRRV